MARYIWRVMETKGHKLTQKRVAMAMREAMLRKKDLMVWCVEPRGFGCRVRKSGAASYIYQFRTPKDQGAKAQKITIGAAAVFSPDEARAVALGHAKTVALGGDPRPKRADADAPNPPKAPETPTLAAVFDLFAQQSAQRLSPKTLDDMRYHLRGMLSGFAERPVDQIRRSEVASLHASLSATPYAANRALATLSRLVGFAEQMEMTPPPGSGWSGNPARGLPRYREQHRDRMLTEGELSALWAALSELEAAERHRFAAAALKLGVLTGWRVGEVRTLEWRDVDLAAREALIHGKTGARKAPLPEPAAALLTAVGRATRFYGLGEHHGRWVFPATAGAGAEAGALTDWEHRRSWDKALALAGLSNLRRHDLRHLVAGVIGLQTGSALRVKEAMGHRSIAVSERYVSPISTLQRRTTDQAAALILEIAEKRRSA